MMDCEELSAVYGKQKQHWGNPYFTSILCPYTYELYKYIVDSLWMNLSFLLLIHYLITKNKIKWNFEIMKQYTKSTNNYKETFN